MVPFVATYVGLPVTKLCIKPNAFCKVELSVIMCH